MKPLGEGPIGGFDLDLGSGFLDPEDLVEIRSFPRFDCWGEGQNRKFGRRMHWTAVGSRSGESDGGGEKEGSGHREKEKENERNRIRDEERGFFFLRR